MLGSVTGSGQTSRCASPHFLFCNTKHFNRTTALQKQKGLLLFVAPSEWRWGSPSGHFYRRSWSWSWSQSWAKPGLRTRPWGWPTASGALFPVSADRRTTAASSTRWCLMQEAQGHASMCTPSSTVTQVKPSRASLRFTLLWFSLLSFFFSHHGERLHISCEYLLQQQCYVMYFHGLQNVLKIIYSANSGVVTCFAVSVLLPPSSQPPTCATVTFHLRAHRLNLTLLTF